MWQTRCKLNFLSIERKDILPCCFNCNSNSPFPPPPFFLCVFVGWKLQFEMRCIRIRCAFSWQHSIIIISFPQWWSIVTICTCWDDVLARMLSFVTLALFSCTFVKSAQHVLMYWVVALAKGNIRCTPTWGEILSCLESDPSRKCMLSNALKGFLLAVEQFLHWCEIVKYLQMTAANVMVDLKGMQTVLPWFRARNWFYCSVTHARHVLRIVRMRGPFFWSRCCNSRGIIWEVGCRRINSVLVSVVMAFCSVL